MGAAPAHSLVVLLTVLTGGRTLLLRDSIDRPVRLYRAPTPYYREGRPPLSSVIITSKPLDLHSTTTSTTSPPSTSRPQWRRHTADDVTEDSPRVPLTRVKTLDFVTNSRRFADFKTSDHKNSDYKTSDHKNSDYITSDHKNSDYKHSDYMASEHKNSDHKTADQKTSEIKTYDHKNSDYITSEHNKYKIPEHKISDYLSDHKTSDYHSPDHKNLDYNTPDHKNSDFNTSDRKTSDYKYPDQQTSEYPTSEHKNSDYMNPDYKHSDYKNEYKNSFKSYDTKRYDYKKNEFKSLDLKQADPRTTEATNANVNIPFYNFECRKGETCSETINLELSTQSPTFKPYPQELLDKFLKDYTTKRQDEGNQEKQPPRSLTRYNDRELIEPVEQPTNRLANLYLESEEPLEAETSEEKPSWDLVPAEKHNHPYDDREGWITLEPVPWSNSKVSKWHSLVKPNKRPSWDENQRPTRPKPWENSNNQWDSKPAYEWDGDRPTKPWDNDKPSKPWEDRPTKPWEDKPFYKPWEDKPAKPWDERPTKPWENDRPHKPSWDNDKPSRPSSWDQDHQRPIHTWSSNSDIITSDTRPHSSSGGSGRPQQWGPPAQPSGYKPNKWVSTSDLITADDGPSAWPAAHKPHEGQHHHHHQPQPNHQPWQRPHPPNHPEAGPGEWVLLSSTKGYSLPSRSRSRQRAMTLMTSAPVNTKRTVRLTVLPADPDKSATSHGGMLEVEKTFQTVDESRERDRISRYQAGKLSDKDAATINDAISKLNVTVVPHHVNINITDDKPNSAQQVVAPVNITPEVQKQELVQDVGSTTFVRGQDNRRTATLAAIGAGMLPATMALLVPMMLGRKKRETQSHQNSTRILRDINHRAY